MDICRPEGCHPHAEKRGGPCGELWKAGLSLRMDGGGPVAS